VSTSDANTDGIMCAMPRTTVDLDGSILEELKRRQQAEGKTLSRLVHELLARTLADEDTEPLGFGWTSKPMVARVDLDDKDASIGCRTSRESDARRQRPRLCIGLRRPVWWTGSGPSGGCRQGPDLLYLFWPVVMAYLRIATHPRLYAEPLDPRQARENIAGLVGRPHIRLASEANRFWALFGEATDTVLVRGDPVPDALVVAPMREHGVRTNWTRDRGFHGFDGIEVVDPFE